MLANFRFEVPDQIALGGVPETPQDVDFLVEQGIRSIVSLHPVPVEAHMRMDELGLRWRPLIVESFPRVPAGLGETLEFVADALARSPALYIHCRGGGGRSGMLLACHYIQRGMSVDEALQKAPGVKSDAQIAFVQGFACGLETLQTGPAR